MSENKSPKALSGVKDAWANPKARKGILLTAGIAGVVLVVTGMSLRNSNTAPTAVAGSAKIAPPPVVKPDITAEVTPQFQKMVVESDNIKAENAAKSNLNMSLPSMTGLSPITAPQAVAPEQQPRQGNPRGQAQQAQPPSPEAVAQLAAQSQMQARAQMEQQIRANPQYAVAGAFMTSAAQQINSAQRSPFSVIMAPQSQQAAGAAAPGATRTGTVATAGGVAGQAQAGVPTTPAQVLIGAGAALYATMDTAINSDYSGPVVATVRQGPYAGARLIGTKTLEFEAVVLKFNSMSPPNGGTAIPVNAYAINLGDVSQYGTTGLQGNVDYHVMKRYVLPAILAFGQTYGYAASMAGTSTTTTDTSTTQSNNPLSSKDRAIVALGGALAPLAADLQRQAQRPVTIRMDANTEIGLLFAADVTDKAQQQAAQAAANGLPMGAAATPVMSNPSTAFDNRASTSAFAPIAPPRTSNPGQVMTPSFTAPYQSALPTYSGQVR